MKEPRFVKSCRDLEVYKASFQFQQDVFSISKAFPREELYSLTDQVRRSSRSIGAGLAEAWSKRLYPAHFLSKLTDSDGELQETTHWLRTALACDYLAEEKSASLIENADAIGRMLGKMIISHEGFCNPIR